MYSVLLTHVITFHNFLDAPFKKLTSLKLVYMLQSMVIIDYWQCFAFLETQNNGSS